MTDSHSLPEANDAEREELLAHFQKLGLTTDDQIGQMRLKAPAEFNSFINGLLDTKRDLQNYLSQILTIKEVIEQYLSRLISEMLDGKDVTDVIESLRQGTEMYPCVFLIRWLVGEGERDLTTLVKEANVDSEYVLPILHRWKYEYKPLDDIWWELERRTEGRENSWTSITNDRYYNDLRHVPQTSIKLESRKRIVWKAREDIDDISRLAETLLRVCLRACREPREKISSNCVGNMRDAIMEIEKIIEEFKALPVLSAQNVSEKPSSI